jgi:ABC-type multidrug transport system fused ATPase/permease subunit
VREVRALILGLDSAIAAEPDTSEPDQHLPPQAPETDESRSGTRLGRYEVLERIGRGATAEVYVGRDTVLNRPVALKFLATAGSSAILPSMMRRFLPEAQAASALNRPNIVTVHEIIESAGGDAPVMVMELVEGQALRQLCGQPMRESRASRILAQVALALGAAHEKGLVHRDLKPENIMVRHDGYVKILDFGLVKRLFQEGSSLEENLTSMAGLPVGTLRYMSPEQCRGEQATSASDIFALGIILHELIAGSHPFVRGDGSGGAFDVAHAIANSDPKALTGATPGYRNLVTRALSKDPKARPSAAEVARTLGAPPPGDTTQFRIKTPVAAPAGSSRRRMVQMAAAGGAFLAAATGAGFYLVSSRRKRGSATEASASRILVRDGIAADPAFSPDGSTIAFTWTPPGAIESHIYLLRDDGKPPVQLTFSGGSEREPCWSPDGSKIAFVRQGAGESAFYVIPGRGGPERRIATNPVPHVVGLLNWLSNNTLVLREYEQGAAPLSRLDLETRTRQPITAPPPTLSDGAPLASPDLKWLTFFRTSSDTTLDLHIVPANATPAVAPKRLTFDEAAKREAAWTPDSSGVVYPLLAFPLAMDGPHILSPRTAAAAYQRKQQEAELLSTVQDDIVAQPLVKAYGLDSRAIAAFLTRNSVLERNSANLGFLTLSMERSAEMTSTVLQIAVLAGGGFLAYRGEMSVGTLAAFQAIFVTLTTSLAELGRYIPEIVHSSGGLARIEEILAAKPRVQDKPDAMVMDTSAPPHIEFRGVTFSYTGTSKTIDNVNLTVPHGQYAAFVGPSGSGKSTILTLALRFYDPLAGSICIGGQDIRSVTQDSLRARMAVVLQDNMLFRISVRENIRCARPGATGEEVEYAAMQAGIHDFILGLPNGYDTRAGGRRGRFSGGQRQRLAIARALLRNPEILLLDEATSALDSATEAKINETIERIAKGRTVISVTHRLAAATKADCIYYMEDGRLVESGSHQELLARNGAYAALWRKQTQETPPAPAAAATAAV